MNVKSEILIFPKKIHTKENKEITIFETSISRKNKEGEYVDNYSLRVNFAPEIMPEEKKARFNENFAYRMDVEGFLTTRSYETEYKVHKVAAALYVTKYELKSKKEIVRKEKPDTTEKPISEDDLLD